MQCSLQMKSIKVPDEIHERLIAMAFLERKKICEVVLDLLDKPTQPFKNVRMKHANRKSNHTKV